MPQTAFWYSILSLSSSVSLQIPQTSSGGVNFAVHCNAAGKNSLQQAK